MFCSYFSEEISIHSILYSVPNIRISEHVLCLRKFKTSTPEIHYKGIIIKVFRIIHCAFAASKGQIFVWVWAKSLSVLCL